MQIRRLTRADAGPFQAFRLVALQEAPAAFGSSYEEECEFSASVIENRLAVRADRGPFGAFVEGELVGLVALPGATYGLRIARIGCTNSDGANQDRKWARLRSQKWHGSERLPSTRIRQIPAFHWQMRSVSVSCLSASCRHCRWLPYNPHIDRPGWRINAIRQTSDNLKRESMNLFAEVMLFLAAASLALFVGALLTEAMVLVPMWRTLQPQEFFTLHAAHAHRLYTFFAPLTVSATLLAVGAAMTAVPADRPLSSASVVAAVLALVILSTYVLYFQRANARFAAASITHEALPAELARWASWHWFRTAIGLVALASALLALRGGAIPL